MKLDGRKSKYQYRMKAKSVIWILLLSLLAFWSVATWVLSFSAIKKKRDHASIFSGRLHQSKATGPNGNAHPALPLPFSTPVLTAYLEGPLPPYDATKTPRLASRTPTQLTKVVFDNAGHTCFDFPNAFPIRVPQDDNGCPVMADPFLPWIHDAFVNAKQTHVEFIAHNQRRCNTNPKVFYKRLEQMEPQAILQQSVPVKKINNHQYALTSLEEADAKETRFICQFKDANSQVLGETLSVFPYNYEHANYQKRNAKPLLTRPENDQDVKASIHNEQVWNSLLLFQCPIPPALQPMLRQQRTQRDDDFPLLYVDVVPIRTYGRLDRAGYFDRAARGMPSDDVTFDPRIEWGNNHVLPPIEKSGRWANIPLCSAHHYVDRTEEEEHATIQQNHKEEPKHFLTACVWASAKFSTRGSADADTSTSERLLEWLTYQLYMAGMDHIYIYDNTTPESDVTLEPITSLFPASKVTRIPWKHPVCNNNKPGAPNPGERSSQYTAEASCRIRFGPDTKWMAVLDTDEYFIPQPPYPSIREWLQQEYSNSRTKILSFYQTRAFPNRDYLDPVPSDDGSDPQWQWKKKPEATFLETYNCDKTTFPKPAYAWRAQKQIFQPSYVLHHFVHYTLVTRRLLERPTEWSGLYIEQAPYEKRVDEEKEGFLLHTKTTYPQATQYWRKQCRDRQDDSCPIGIPFPPGAKEGDKNEEGMAYNCYAHDRVTNDMVPPLRKLLEPLQAKYRAT